MDARTSRWLGIVETALLPLGVLAYLVMPHGIGADGWTRLETTRLLLQGHISPARFSIIQSALAAPLYVIGQAIDYPQGVVALFNTGVILGGLAAMAFLLRRQVSASLLRRLILLLLASSMFGHHAQLFTSEPLTSMAVAVGLLCVLLGRPVAGYSLVIVGVINTPAALPALFLALLAGARSPRRLWQAVWPTVACATLIMTEFYVRRGSPLLTGYENDHGWRTVMPYSGQSTFSYPFVFGLLSILFSFGKGLALYIPGLWLLFVRPSAPVPELVRRFQRYAVWFVVGLVAIYSKYWAWYGAWFWGPRYFLFACLPASVALALHLCDDHASSKAKALTLGVLLWSGWVAIDGAVIGEPSIPVCAADRLQLESLCWYTPEFSALFYPFVDPMPLNLRQMAVGAYFVAVTLVLAVPFSIALTRVGAMSVRAWVSASRGPRPGHNQSPNLA